MQSMFQSGHISLWIVLRKAFNPFDKTVVKPLWIL